MRSNSSRPTLEVFLSLLCLGSAFFIYNTLAPADALTVTVFKEGKSVVVLVENPRGKTVLVDTGSDASILRDLGTTLPEWQRTIGLVVLSDLSSAVAGAAPLLLSRYRARALLRSNTALAPSLERELSEVLGQDSATTLLGAEKGERLRLARNEYLEVLWPPTTKSALHQANGALALRLTYGDAVVVFEENLTPRMKALVETQMAESPPPTLRISSSTPPGAYTLLPTGVLRETK